jgi:hypothetical protein
MNLLMALIFTFSCFTLWAQSPEDIPPPPVPDHMKRRGFKKAPPAPPRRSRVQPVSSAQPQTNSDKQQAKSPVANRPANPPAQPQVKSPNPNPQKPLSTAQSVDQQPPTQKTATPIAKEPKVSATAQQKKSPHQLAKQPQPKAKPQKNTAVNPARKTKTSETKTSKTKVSSKGKPNPSIPAQRQPSNAKAFKAGMHNFSKNCTMFTQPDSNSGTQGQVSAGKKLWVDGHSSQWHKVYKQSGAVYIPADCIQ